MLHYLERLAVDTPDAIAIESPAMRLTYATLLDRVRHLGIWLSGLDASAIALDLPDNETWVVAHLACLYANIPQLPLPPFFTAEQRQHAMRDAGVNYLLATATTESPHQWQYKAMAIMLQGAANPPAILPGGTAVITYTSGSTGTPKGVCLGVPGMTRVAESLVEVLGVELAARHLSVLPMAVLLEQIGGLYATLISGGTYVFADVQKDLRMLPHALQESQASSCILVPELLKMLVQHAAHAQAEFPQLQFVAVGGARVSDALLEQAFALGLPVYQGYGLTESASVVAVNTPGAHRSATVGKPLPHIRYRLAEDGEIILTNPALLGYTGDAFYRGYYATGDLGSIDAEGYLHIHGRKKNILITAHGRNVSPEWPESLLLAQPEIAQAMAYGDAQPTLSALIVPSTANADIGAAVARVNAALPEYARIGEWQPHAAFTVANGLLTGTGRIRRDAVMQTLYHQGEDYGFLRSSGA